MAAQGMLAGGERGTRPLAPQGFEGKGEAHQTPGEKEEGSGDEGVHLCYTPCFGS